MTQVEQHAEAAAPVQPAYPRMNPASSADGSAVST